jgi:hypothetical protein
MHRRKPATRSLTLVHVLRFGLQGAQRGAPAQTIVLSLSALLPLVKSSISYLQTVFFRFDGGR